MEKNITFRSDVDNALAIKSTKTKISSTSWLDKIINSLLYAVIFLLPIFFLPFYGFSLGAAKEALIAPLVLLAGILWVIKVIMERKITFINTRVNKLLFILLVTSGLSTLLSYMPNMGIVFGSDTAYLTIITISILLFWLISVNFNFIRAIYAYFILIISLSLLSIFGLINVFGINAISVISFDKFFTPIGSFNALGIAAALNIILILGFLNFHKFSSKTLQIIAKLLMIISFATLVIVNYLWIWIIFALIILFMLALKIMHNKVSAVSNTKALVFPLILVFISFWFIFAKYAIIDVPVVIAPTLYKTIEVTFSSFGGDIKNFLFGFGPGTFEAAFDFYKSAAINTTIFWNTFFNTGWSAWFTYFFSFGVLGIGFLLILFISILAQSLKTFFKFWNIENKSSVIGALSGLNGVAIFLIIGGFLSLNYNFALTTILFTILALILVINTYLHQEENTDISITTINLTKSSHINLTSLLSLVLALIVGISMLYFEGRRIAGTVMFANGVQIVNNAKTVNDVDKGLSSIIKANEYDIFNSIYLQTALESLLFQAQALVDDKNISVEERTQSLQAIINNAAFIKNIMITNKSGFRQISTWLALGNFYEGFIPLLPQAHTFATSSYKQGKLLSPVNPIFDTNIARSNIILFDAMPQGTENREELLNQALDFINSALELKEDYLDAHLLRALVLERLGNKEQAISYLQELLKFVPENENIIKMLQALQNSNQQSALSPAQQAQKKAQIKEQNINIQDKNNNANN